MKEREKERKSCSQKAIDTPTTDLPNDSQRPTDHFQVPLPQRLPAKDGTDALGSGASIRNAIGRIREDGRTIRSGRSAVRSRRRVRKAEAVRTERVSIDLAEIIADVAIAFVRVLQLQDIARSARDGDFKRMAAVTFGRVGFGVTSGGGGHTDRCAAACWMLFADVDIGGKVAFVLNRGRSCGTGATARATARARG